MKNGCWESLVSCKINDIDCPGVTDDPRLVEIAEKILLGRHTELSPGQMFVPLEQPKDNNQSLKSEDVIGKQPSTKKKTLHRRCSVI
jgi:hypothetical protein